MAHFIPIGGNLTETEKEIILSHRHLYPPKNTDKINVFKVIWAF